MQTTEENTFEVTPAASEQLAEHFRGQKPVPIRIFLNGGG